MSRHLRKKSTPTRQVVGFRQKQRTTVTRRGGGKRSHRQAIRRRKKQRQHKLGGVIIPEINQKPIQTRCFRFQGAFDSPNIIITSQDIRSMLGFVNGSSTEFYPIIDSFRLNRVGLTLFPMDSTTGFGNLGMKWQGDNSPDIYDSMLVGNTEPNHLSFRPPEASTAWFWNDNLATTVNMFSISMDNDSVEIVMDIELQYIIADGLVTSVPLSMAAAFTGFAARSIPLGTQEFAPALLSTVL